MEVACFKKVHNFQIDLWTCTRFSGNVGHEPKDSRLTVQANWQKGCGSGSGLEQKGT